MTYSHYDVIIIGSGFGGAVCGLRAVEAGQRVAILERGRCMTPEYFELLARGELAVFHGESTPAPLELHRLNGLIALTASGLGGGSNLYTAVTLRAPPESFVHYWPDGLNQEQLAPYYDDVEAMIQPTPIPGDLPRTQALQLLATRLPGTFTRLPLAMDWPEDTTRLVQIPEVGGVYAELTTWLQGGRAARKRTLRQTYLAAAEVAGAEIHSLHEAVVIKPHRKGYEVQCRVCSDELPCSQGNWSSQALTAERVVLAAGTLNTTRLLLHCRDIARTLPQLSPMLGKRFFTNGDFGGLLLGPDLDLRLDSGPPVTGWLDYWARDRLYLMETGLLPFDFGGFSGLLNPARWFGGLNLAPAQKRTWSFGVMGYGNYSGRLVLGRGGRLVHQHNLEGTTAFLDLSVARLQELAAAAGARLLVPPAIIARRLPITVHPLGGAIMAESTDNGVADSRGEVFGYPGLYISDGSLIPSPTGVPPSMTIAAVAERVAHFAFGDGSQPRIASRKRTGCD